MTATLHAIPVGNLKSVSAQLRAVADEIDSGVYGEVQEGVLVLQGLEVFGLGVATSMVAHFILAQAQRKLERIDMS